MNYKRMAENHIAQLKRQVGNDGSGRYSFMIDRNDIISNYVKMRDELGYPLMIDSRNRRAIVYNKKGLEKKLNKLVDECIAKNIKILESVVADDITNSVISQLNSITQTANGTIVKGGKSSSSFASMFGSAIGKGLVDGVGKILDDMSDVEKR